MIISRVGIFTRSLLPANSSSTALSLLSLANNLLHSATIDDQIDDQIRTDSEDIFCEAQRITAPSSSNMANDKKNGDTANDQEDRRPLQPLDRNVNPRSRYTGRLGLRAVSGENSSQAQRENGFAPSATYNAPGSKRWRENQLGGAKDRSSTEDAGPVGEEDSGYAVLKDDPKNQTEDREPSFLLGRNAFPGSVSKPPASYVPAPAPRTVAATAYIASRKLESDWRAGAKVLSPPKDFATKSKAFSSTRLTWKDFKQGVVFWAAWECHSNRECVDPKDPDLYPTYDGPKIMKNRLYICVSKSETQMKCVPIFSHNDGGIDKIPKERQYEYSCMSQVGQDSEARKHPGGLTMLWFESGKSDFVLRKTSTAHLLGAKPILYDQPITVVGQLNEQSLTHLKNQIVTAEGQAERRFGKLTEKQQRETQAAKTTAGLSQLTSRLGQMGRKFREERG